MLKITDGFSALHKYNPVGTLASAEYRLGDNSTQVNCAFGYDGRDHMVSKSYNAGSNPQLSMTWTFDDRDELTNSSTFLRPASGNDTNSTTTYAADANHNRTRLSGNTTNTTSYTNNLADQTTAAGTLSLAFNGAGAVNQTTQVGADTRKFTYDYKDQLTQFVAGPTTVNYKYDANNRLTARNATVGTSSNSSTSSGTAKPWPKNTTPTATSPNATSAAKRSTRTATGTCSSATTRAPS